MFRSVLVLIAAAIPLLCAQKSSNIPGIPARALVTVEAKKKGPPPQLSAQDIQAYEGKDRERVSGWLSMTGAHASLQFLVMLDDDSGLNLDTQLNDIRAFITNQPATTAVAVGYMRNGTVLFASQFTTNHEQAAKSLRLPIGEAGVNGSPYFSLSDVVKRWPAGQAERREILMITDGIDRYGIGTGLDDPYVNSAISDAQKAGIVVFSIYTRGSGHFGHSFWRNNWGQNFLSQVSDETGGESFWFGFGSPVSFKPYLDDLTQRLNCCQYMLTVVAKPQDKAALRQLKLHTEVHSADLAYPDRIWVPAGK